MRTEKRDGAIERRLVIGLIVDPAVLSRIASRWTKDAFRSKWSNLVGGWCVSYWNRFGKAPGKAIEGLFESWADDSKDDETVIMVENFLAGLSGQYEDIGKESPSDYLLDLADKHLNEVRARRLSELIAGDLDGGDLDRALTRLDTWSRVDAGSETHVDLLQDLDEIDAAMDETETEPLIVFPGDLGKFFGDVLGRDKFIAFMGPEKRGKTWVLGDLAWTAATQRRKTAFFGAGDMTKRQMIRRFMTRVAQRPLKPCTVRYPKEITRDADDKYASVTFDEMEFSERLDRVAAREAVKKAIRSRIKSEESYLRLECHPNSTLSVSMIANRIKSWERAGWGPPDVVVIDYADILMSPVGVQDPKEKIDLVWRELRALSQKLHCLLVTATQTTRESYDVRTIEMKHASDQKKKLAHVDGMIGLNQTRPEKEMGVMRYNWVALREAENNPYRCVHVAGCLSLGNPRVRSTF